MDLGVVSLEGLLVNVLSRSETSIAVEIYSQRDDTLENIFYLYRSGEIEAATGIPATELERFVDDIFHSILVPQGFENFDVTSNPNVIPTTVDYVTDFS